MALSCVMLRHPAVNCGDVASDDLVMCQALKCNLEV